MQKPEAQAREKIVQHLQSSQLDRVSRVCISTIQRLYSMLRSLFFWIETLMPQGQSREETGNASFAFNEAYGSRPLVCPLP